jgi:trans-aconitate methyltransferase
VTARYNAPEQWVAGPDLVYGELARAAVALLPPAADVLDAGAGTGAVTRALLARGARVLAVDGSLPMLRRVPMARAVAADVCALPLASGCVDAAVAGFVLSHVADPVAALRELARVVQPGGTVLATAFPAGVDSPRHPAKAALDRVLDEHGYRTPGWYERLKTDGEPRVGGESQLERLASAAGLGDARVNSVDVPLAGLDAAALVRWRFGMPQVVPWLDALSTDERAALEHAGLAALDGQPPAPLPMLVLRGSVLALP